MEPLTLNDLRAVRDATRLLYKKALPATAQLWRHAVVLWTAAVAHVLRSWGTHVYLRGVRAENRRRGVTSHRYRQGMTPIKHSWEAMRLAGMFDLAGLSDRYAAGWSS